MRITSDMTILTNGSHEDSLKRCRKCIQPIQDCSNHLILVKQTNQNEGSRSQDQTTDLPTNLSRGVRELADAWRTKLFEPKAQSTPMIGPNCYLTPPMMPSSLIEWPTDQSSHSTDEMEVYHAECLRCFRCGQCLSTMNRLCWKYDKCTVVCMHCRIRLTHCARCQLRVSNDAWVYKFNKLPFHVSCLICDKCDRPLQSGDRCGLWQDRVYCLDQCFACVIMRAATTTNGISPAEMMLSNREHFDPTVNDVTKMVIKEGATIGMPIGKMSGQEIMMADSKLLAERSASDFFLTNCLLTNGSRNRQEQKSSSDSKLSLANVDPPIKTVPSNSPDSVTGCCSQNFSSRPMTQQLYGPNVSIEGDLINPDYQRAASLPAMAATIYTSSVDTDGVSEKRFTKHEDSMHSGDTTRGLPIVTGSGDSTTMSTNTVGVVDPQNGGGNSIDSSTSSGCSNTAKSKRIRTSFTPDQLAILQANFDIEANPDGQELERIANVARLNKRVTQVWFQNARARKKKIECKTLGSALGSNGLNGISPYFTTETGFNTLDDYYEGSDENMSAISMRDAMLSTTIDSPANMIYDPPGALTMHPSAFLGSECGTRQSNSIYDSAVSGSGMSGIINYSAMHRMEIDPLMLRNGP